MKKLLIRIIPLFLLLCFTFGCQKQVEEAKPTLDIEAEKEVIISTFKEGLRKFEELQREGDILAIAEFYVNAHTENAVLMFPGQPAIIGRENIYTYMKESFSEVIEEYFFEFPNWKTEELQVAGDWAFHRFSGVAILKPKKGGDLIELDRKYLDIWKKQQNGEWKIAIHSFNLNK